MSNSRECPCASFVRIDKGSVHVPMYDKCKFPVAVGKYRADLDAWVCGSHGRLWQKARLWKDIPEEQRVKE